LSSAVLAFGALSFVVVVVGALRVAAGKRQRFLYGRGFVFSFSGETVAVAL
jgi:hypothetical protein